MAFISTAVEGNPNWQTPEKTRKVAALRIFIALGHEDHKIVLEVLAVRIQHCRSCYKQAESSQTENKHKYGEHLNGSARAYRRIMSIHLIRNLRVADECKIMSNALLIATHMRILSVSWIGGIVLLALPSFALPLPMPVHPCTRPPRAHYVRCCDFVP